MPAAPEKAGPARLTHLRPLGTGPLSSAGPVALALAGWAFCFIGNWRGTDWAAQVYRSHQAAHWGFAIWDPGWYGGTYPLNYSLVYPLAAGYLGLWLLAAASVAGAAYCFDRLVVREFGKRPAGSWYFAAATVVEVAIGQLPTLAAEALALGSVLCLANCRRAARRRPGPSHRGPTTKTGRCSPSNWPVASCSAPWPPSPPRLSVLSWPWCCWHGGWQTSGGSSAPL